MDARQVLELVDGRLRGRDPELVLELPRGRDAHAELLRLDLLLREVIEWVRAACVRPHVRERDLLRRTLLQEKLSVGRPEHEGGEGAMQEALVDVLHQVAYIIQIALGAHARHNSHSSGKKEHTGLLVGCTNSIVLFVHQDTPLVHQPRLLGIVARQINVSERR